MNREGYIVPAGDVSVDLCDIDRLKDILNEIMSDDRVVELLNMGALRTINNSTIKKFNEMFKLTK